MLINLDPWLRTSNWTTKQKIPPKGVDVIDQCLSASKSNKTMGPHPKSPKLSPRKRFPNPKYKEYVVNVPSGYCPKSRVNILATEPYFSLTDFWLKSYFFLNFRGVFVETVRAVHHI